MLDSDAWRRLAALGSEMAGRLLLLMPVRTVTNRLLFSPILLLLGTGSTGWDRPCWVVAGAVPSSGADGAHLTAGGRTLQSFSRQLPRRVAHSTVDRYAVVVESWLLIASIVSLAAAAAPPPRQSRSSPTPGPRRPVAKPVDAAAVRRPIVSNLTPVVCMP